MKKDIRVLKLSTGEDIVGIIHEENSNSVYIKKPLKIIKSPNLAESKITLYFMVWGELKVEEEPVYINPSHIVSYYWLNDYDYKRILRYIENSDEIDETDFIEKDHIPIN